MLLPTNLLVVFQSRAGFSPRRDRTPMSRRAGAASSFNPVLGFLLAATRSLMTTIRKSRSVSIPCWVFSSPRRLPHRPTVGCPLCFNPVLGFLLAATSLDRQGAGAANVFQSRAGFSPRRDVCSDNHGTFARSVSIPCWVFSSPRQYPFRKP